MPFPGSGGATVRDAWLHPLPITRPNGPIADGKRRAGPPPSRASRASHRITLRRKRAILCISVHPFLHRHGFIGSLQRRGGRQIPVRG